MAIQIGRVLSVKDLAASQTALQKSLSRLSSGQRITQAGDDAAGLAISEKLRATERSFAQAERNLSDGISLTRTADGALGQQTEITIRLRELAVQAQNGTLDDASRGSIQREFDQLTSEITRIAEATRFGGRNLLNGEASGAGAFTIRDGTSSDGSGVVSIALPDARSDALGLAGLQASDGATLDRLDEALQSLSSTRGDLGAAESRLASATENVRVSRETTSAALSRIRDTDFAQASAESARAQIQQRIQVAVQVQANISAGTALRLLG
jgi:flagellin